MNSPLAEQKGALWKLILRSSRESADYHDALVGLMHTKTERKRLYELVENAEIDRMLDLLYLESRATTSTLGEEGQKSALVILKKMCKTHDRWPTSFIIKDVIEVDHRFYYPGSGRGYVYRAQYNGKAVAIKTMKVFRTQDGTDDVSLHKAKQKLCNGALVWKLLSHPNLVPFLGVSETPFGLALVSEWIERGTILQFIKNNPETNRLKLLHDVASGLEYLHNFPIVHSDIKIENILIDSHFNARITDFGMANLLLAMLKSIKTLPPDEALCWVAPEQFKDASPSTMKSDVFLFGIVAYEVFAGSPLRKRPPIVFCEIMMEFAEGEPPMRPPGGERLGLDDRLWDEMQVCFNSNPEARPTMKDIRSLLEPRHKKWTPPTPDGPAKSDLARWRDESENYVDFTRYSDRIAPSRPHSGTGISLGTTPLASGESPGNERPPEPVLASTRTREWVLAQRSDLFPKISRPGVTFEEVPVVFDIPARPGAHDTIVSTEPWTRLFPDSTSGDDFEVVDFETNTDLDTSSEEDPLRPQCSDTVSSSWSQDAVCDF